MRIPMILSLTLAIFQGGQESDDKSPRDASASPSRFPVLAGIGAALAITDDGPEIGLLAPGSVAERSGKLHVGDRILAVRNGDVTIELKGKKMGEVVSLIRGPVGTTVTLEILPKGSQSRSLVTLKREAIPAKGGKLTYDDLIGKVPPAVELATLDQTSRTTLPDYAGQVVVLDFWASWCGSCYAPVDKLQGIARSHPEWKGRVALLTATIDTDLQAASNVVKTRQWKETIHLSLPPEKLEAMEIVSVPIGAHPVARWQNRGCRGPSLHRHRERGPKATPADQVRASRQVSVIASGTRVACTVAVLVLAIRLVNLGSLFCVLVIDVSMRHVQEYLDYFHELQGIPAGIGCAVAPHGSSGRSAVEGTANQAGLTVWVVSREFWVFSRIRG